MTVAIMQPYFLPYIGYWQLMAAVDRFVVYDNIQYTKKGWINRNRFLRNGAAAVFTLPVKKAPHTFDVVARAIADEFDPDALLNPLEDAYRAAPFFSAVFPVLQDVIRYATRNLFAYLHHSLTAVARYLEIATPIVVSSTIEADHALTGEGRVLGLCQALGATRYINSMGGRELYSPAAFEARGIELRFLRPQLPSYPQYDHPFVPELSIVDVMMFNSRDAVRAMLGAYELL